MPRLKPRDPTQPVMVRLVEAARLLDVSVATVRRWLADGTLRAIVIPGKERKVDMASIDKLRQAKKP